jgi:4'-phosphopantetheinyl transferase EntD
MIASNTKVCLITTGLALTDESDLQVLAEEQSIISRIENPEAKLRFKAGRTAARRALCKLNPDFATFPLARASSGLALWPENYCGSISHKDDIAIAAAASTTQIDGLGLDIERKYEKDPWRLIKRISGQAEETWAQQQQDPAWAASAIFAAKESAVKSLQSLIPEQRLLLKQIQLYPSGSLDASTIIKFNIGLAVGSQYDHLSIRTMLARCDDYLIAISWITSCS